MVEPAVSSGYDTGQEYIKMTKKFIIYKLLRGTI
jgi:hypothetical protein